MRIPILVEPIAGNGFRARGFALDADGHTREEAVEEFSKLLKSRMESGASILEVDVPDAAHPLAKFAGMFKDDPWFAKWQKSIAKYRREVDEDPKYL